VHRTGPSLDHVWGRKAGTAQGFDRYSGALKSSGITWNAQTLDQWLTNPATLVPGNVMGFPGVANQAVRQDIIAYLKAVSEGKAPRSGNQHRGGMMGGGPKLSLKIAPPAGQVIALEHCRDTYTVRTADGKTNKVWEFNLRLKTDSSADGPAPGKPVIVGAGMQGDRASVVFASPAEITGYIKESCD
jgi:cytochrome c